MTSGSLKTRTFSFGSSDLMLLYSDPNLLGEQEAHSPPTCVRKRLGSFPLARKGKELPYLWGSLAQTLDGSLTLCDDHRGSAVARAHPMNRIGGEIDFWLLNVYRFFSDAVIIGAQTIRREPYLTSHIWDSQLVAARPVGRKVPLHIVATDSGDLGYSPAILSNPSIPLILHTNMKGWDFLKESLIRPYCLQDRSTGFSWDVLQDKVVILLEKESVRGRERDLIRWLKGSVGRVLIESPTYLQRLLLERLIDELFITTCGILSGRQLGCQGGLERGFLPYTQALSLYQSRGSYWYARHKVFYQTRESISRGR